MNRKIMSLVIVGIFLFATFGTISAEKQNTYARNPSIQNSKYYMLEFSIESNTEKAFLVLDGEKHEMIKENGKYICRTSFEEGDHEYYFELDGMRLPEKGSYKITEVERRWILLNSLIDNFNWKLNEEIKLTKENSEKSIELQESRIETCAMIRGIIKRILVSEMLNPENFDTETVFNKIDTENLEKLADLYGIKFKEKGKTIENLYTFFEDTGEKYIKITVDSYKQRKNYDLVSDNVDLQKIEIAKKNKDWISMIVTANKLIKNRQNIEKALNYKFFALASLYGDKDINDLRKEEKDGYSVRTLYEWTNERHQWEEKHYGGYTFLVGMHAYWGKLFGCEYMDYNIQGIANASLVCDVIIVYLGYWAHGCWDPTPDHRGKNYSNWVDITQSARVHKHPRYGYLCYPQVHGYFYDSHIPGWDYNVYLNSIIGYR